jgi:hypothetical protein
VNNNNSSGNDRRNCVWMCFMVTSTVACDDGMVSDTSIRHNTHAEPIVFFCWMFQDFLLLVSDGRWRMIDDVRLTDHRPKNDGVRTSYRPILVQ